MIIAIKGKIGTGKTTVANYICEKYNFKVINGDDVVREMYVSNKEVVTKVNSHFNLQGDVVDRKQLGKIVFSDEEKLKHLEQIVHPYLSKEINDFINDNENVIIDAQVIDKIDVNYEYVLVCSATTEDIISRVKSRDGRDEKQIREILKLQETGYVLDKRTYVVNTSNENVNEQIDKVMKGFYDCESWQDSKYS